MTTSRNKRNTFPLAIGVGMVLVAIFAVGTTFFSADAASTTNTNVGDDVVAAVASSGNIAYVAVRDFNGARLSALRVFQLRGNELTELPTPPDAAALDEGLPLYMDIANASPCVQYSIVSSGASNFVARIACFRDGSWDLIPDVNVARAKDEWINLFAVRNGEMFVSVRGANSSAERFLKLRGSSWIRASQPISGRNLVVNANPPRSVQDPLSVSIERSRGKAGRGERQIFRLLDGRWEPATSPTSAPYGAQTGAAVGNGRKWIISESRARTGREAMLVKFTSGSKWRTMPPGNVNKTRGFAQGGMYLGANNSVWLAWSEQGRVSRRGASISVLVARVNTRTSRLGKVKTLWRGRIGGFPPIPKVFSAGARTFVAFERVTKVGSLESDSVVESVDGRTRLVLPE